MLTLRLKITNNSTSAKDVNASIYITSNNSALSKPHLKLISKWE